MKRPDVLKCAPRFFHSYLNETILTSKKKKKKSTVSSFNLIPCYFLAKSRERQL